MGLFSSNDNTDQDEDESTFAPVACNDTMVLGYYRETAGSDPQLVWVSNSEFDRIDSEDIDTVI